MTHYRRLVLVALIAFAAAVAGVFLGRALFPLRSPARAELHDVLHDELNLDAQQRAQLAVLEQRFAVRQRALELELRANNARLADAIEAEHGFGPRVVKAVDASHGAMGEIQKETLAHVFAMRQILRPAQATKFDSAVVHALTDDER